MFEGSAKDKCFPAMLGVRPSGAGTIMDKGFRADRDKWMAVVVVMPVHVCIGQYAWICGRLTEEEQLALNLG
jgi:hypothetical protein